MILGTDKHNIAFSLYRDMEREEIQVYCGFALLETLPDAPENPACKLLLARLYNAGIPIKSLLDVFDFDPKTIRGWGRCLRGGNAQELIRVLEGRSHRRKLTAQVEAFVRIRLADLLDQREYGAVKTIRQDIKTIFSVEISAKSLGPLIREIKAQVHARNSTQATGPDPSSSTPPCHLNTDPCVGSDRASATTQSGSNWPGSEPQNREIGSQCSPEGVEGDCVHKAVSCKEMQDNPQEESPDNTAKVSPYFCPELPQHGHRWCEHAGLLMFATRLMELSKGVGATHPLLIQWLSALLLGAQNIEQTKFLRWEDLELLLGQAIRVLAIQRQQLKALSTEAILVELFAFNARILDTAVKSDFYFDPHTKHYTGEQNVLKGWCAKLRWADKVLQSDFIHTASGSPIYFETTDSFEDLRGRFFGVIERARTVLKWPTDKVLSYVVDRGIFGAEVFEKVLADPKHHLITWEKGYVAEPWDSTKVSGSMKMTRTRNHSKDLRTYDFQYRDEIWEKDPRLRRIVVRATNDRGRVVQVAILTDDLLRPAPEIIELMFRRWLQENDFKYLDKHFGINQITSYRVIEYDQLKGHVKDRQIKSGQRKGLEARRQKVRAGLAQLLLVQEAAEQRQRQREPRMKELKAAVEIQTAMGEKPEEQRQRQAANELELKKLQRVEEKHVLASQERSQKIQKLSQKIDELAVELLSVEQSESRLEAMIAAHMVRMEPQSKRLLDTLRIIARNLFYEALQPFKKQYDNHRDDHDYFRKLSQSAAVLEFGKEEIVIHLMPVCSYAPAMKRIIGSVLEGINQTDVRMPNGGQQKLRFRLGSRSEIRLHLEVPPKT